MIASGAAPVQQRALLVEHLGSARSAEARGDWVAALVAYERAFVRLLSRRAWRRASPLR